jgi:hypothetical protein
MTRPFSIAMWSGPRNLSTTMMRSFGARRDTAIVDEPFYAAYLKLTGSTHPMTEEILSTHDSDPARVIAQLTGPAPGGASVFYQKHMVHHMIAHIPTDWLGRIHRHVLLIRHPARVVASYARKMETLSPEAMGFPQQEALWSRLAALPGAPPRVVDADRILADPARVLQRLCAALGLDWDPAMLAWRAGPHPADGAWAPHWYDAVWRSTGFGPAPGPLPELAGEASRIAGGAVPAYERLLACHV